MRTKHAKPSGKIPWTRGERWVLRGVLGLLGVLALAAGWLAVEEERERIVIPAGSDIRLPLPSLRTGRTRLVTYSMGGSASVSVAVERGDDKVIRVALGTCRSCRGSSSYTWSGRLMCGRCRQIMKLPAPGSGTGERQGGCVLTEVAYSIAGNELVIRGESIVAAVARQSSSGAKAGSS